MVKNTVTVYCDRCGKICEDIKNTHAFRFMKRNYYVEKWKYGEATKVDLCQSCYDSFAKWIKGEQNNG